jgi:hypothetical protein
VTSYGPSGIGFVNFGAIGRLDVQAPIETFGPGVRGFNLYDGSLEHASSQSIATHGDGSIGVQVSKHLPVLDIAGDLTTDGDEGIEPGQAAMTMQAAGSLVILGLVIARAVNIPR